MNLKTGDIVRMVAPGSRGEGKDGRTHVFVGYDNHGPVAVCCTSSPIDPNDPKYVLLPWNENGSTSTGFREKIYAECHWRVPIPDRNDYPRGPFVPLRVVARIIEKMRPPKPLPTSPSTPRPAS